MVETQAANQTQPNKSVVIHNSDMLQHLVTEAVKKVLADQEVADTDKVSQNIVSQVVEGLKPTLASGSAVSMRNTVRNVIGKHIAIPTPITKPVACVYNPTPISELKKRHIPVVSYMPTRESRVAIKRKTSPERNKPWLNIIQESGNSQPTEITYKPTAIVNATSQDTVQNYVPTIKPDSPSSNSYDDNNSNDYQIKFKEEYCPRLKKKREEYVPKSIKAPLKTTQELEKATLEQLESEFDMIDEIYTSGHSSSTLRQSKTLHSEDSQDYPLDIEPKFSDDESIEDIFKDENSVKEAEQIEDMDEKKKDARISAVDKETSNKASKVCKNHYETKTDNIESSDKSKQHKAEDANKSFEKRRDSIKENASKEKERYRSSHNKKEKDRKDRYNSESKDKEKSRHKSDSRDRHHSSSSKDKDKDKDRKKNSHYSKNSSHKSREHSDSRKSKSDSSKKDRNDHYKSSRHESKSKSSTKSSKHTSNTKLDHHSESNRRSNYSSRKSVKHKESSSERNYSSDRSSVPDSIHSFVDNEILELSDSDHDVQEECLRIFQVNNIY